MHYPSGSIVAGYHGSLVVEIPDLRYAAPPMNNSNRREFMTAGMCAASAIVAHQLVRPATAVAQLPQSSAAPDFRIQHGQIRQSVMGWCFAPLSPEQLARHCKQIGLVAIEGIPREAYPKVRELGLEISLVSSHGFAEGPCNPRFHDKVVEKLTDAIQVAKAVKCQRVITFTGMKFEGMDRDRAIRDCLDVWKKVLPIAEANGVTLCLEHLNSRDGSHPMKGHPGYFGDDVDFCIDLIRQIGSPNFRLLFDIYHVSIMNGDVIRRIRQYHEYIAHYHTAGNPGRGELDDTQEINYPAVMQAILETNYQGFVAQEFIPTWTDKVAALRHAAQVCDVPRPTKAALPMPRRAVEGPAWVQVTVEAPWQPRDSQGELVFRDQLWLLGGWFNSFAAPPRDVWSSPDGKSWRQVTPSAPWKHSDLPMTVSFQDRMWLMGGWYNGRLPGHSASNEVWSSGDGVEWQQVTERAPWSARLASGLIEFQGQMWLLGGTENYYFGDEKSLKNDVWSSVNGRDWTCVTERAPWAARAYHQVAVLGNKLYLFGGGNYVPQYQAFNDVWCSEDGKEWRCVTEQANWSPRLWFSAVTHLDHLWVLGGWSNNPSRNWGDVWFSQNGKQWTELKSPKIWKERHEHSAYVFQNKIWIAGGHAQPLSSEVWSLDVPRNLLGH